MRVQSREPRVTHAVIENQLAAVAAEGGEVGPGIGVTGHFLGVVRNRRFLIHVSSACWSEQAPTGLKPPESSPGMPGPFEPMPVS